MTQRRKRQTRFALLVVGIFLGASIAAPFLNAGAFRARIQAALETALHRKVEIGAVHFTLLTGPGFIVDDVLIADDPSAGIEPFAHVDNLKATLALRTLWNGRLSFSTLKLNDPTVNLVKTAGGSWNVRAFLASAASAGRGSHEHASIPDIQISGGRLDLKFGDTKSVFYINDADVEVYPNSNGDVVIHLSGEPARTDRSVQGFGRFYARGLLMSGGTAEDRLNMAVQVDHSSIAELARLTGNDASVHGYVSTSAMLSGPLSHIAITGDLNVGDIHRWDLMPAAGENWTVKYHGTFNVRSQRLEIETDAASVANVPVALKFRASDLITAPKWGATVTFRALPAASLAATTRNLGLPLPDLRISGMVNGAIGYSRPGALEGELAIENGTVEGAGGGELRFPIAPVTIAAGQLSFGPATVTLANGHAAEVHGSYGLADHSLAVDVNTDLLTIADLRAAAGPQFAAPGIAILDRCREGAWKGTVQFTSSNGQPGTWDANAELSNAVVSIDGLAQPVHLAAAAVRMREGELTLRNARGRAGKVHFLADYSRGAAPRDHLRVRIASADVADFEKLLLPTLRRSRGLFASLRHARVPDWLRERQLQGSVHIGALLQGAAPVCAFDAHLLWTGATVELQHAACAQDDMHATGAIVADLSGSAPRYRVSGEVDGASYRGGRIEVDGSLDTTGTGADLLANARGQGAFNARDVTFGPDSEFRELAGNYSLGANGAPRLVLTNLQATTEDETLSGQGAGSADGRIVFDLTSGRKQLKLSGSLLPVRAPAGE